MSARARRIGYLAIVAAAWLPAAASAQVTQAWSANLAGFINIRVPSNGMAQGTLPFQPLEQPLAITNTIGAQMGAGAVVMLWNLASNGYLVANRGARGGWIPGTLTFHPGEGFWLDGRGMSFTSPFIRVCLGGEVPDANTQSNYTLTPVQGLDLVGYPYPRRIHFTNTTLYAQGEVGDRIMIWDAALQGYTTNVLTGSGWSPPVTGLILRTGMDFWYGASNQVDWTEPKPYVQP